MAPPLIQLTDIVLTFGGTPLLDGAELSVAPGERVCLVGRNGSGKSTLLRIAAGLIDFDRGTRAGPCRCSRHSPPRRAHQPPRPAHDRVAGDRSSGAARGSRDDQPRPA